MNPLREFVRASLNAAAEGGSEWPTPDLPASLSVLLHDWTASLATPAEDIAAVSGLTVDEVRALRGE